MNLIIDTIHDGNIQYYPPGDTNLAILPAHATTQIRILYCFIQYISMEYMVYICNCMAVKSLGWMTPLEKLTRQTPDISIMLQMSYRQLVFFKEHEYSFPESPYERFGYFVGFSTSVGHSNTFKILDVKTGKILFWSRVRLPKGVPTDS